MLLLLELHGLRDLRVPCTNGIVGAANHCLVLRIGLLRGALNPGISPGNVS